MIRSPRALSALAFTLFVAGCSGGKDKNESTQAPHVDSVSPATGTVGANVTIAGTDFGDESGDEGGVAFGGVEAAIVSWSDDEIVATVPSAAFPGARDITVTNADGTSNAAAFTVVLPRAIYWNDDIFTDNSVEALSISASNTAASLAGSPYLQGIQGPGYAGDGKTLAIDTARRRLFTTAKEKLYAWSIDGASGVITTTGTLALTGADYLYGVTVTPDGSKVYVADYDGGRVFGAAVASNGTLTAIAGSPFDSGLAGASKIALSMDGSFLYANNEDPLNAEIRGFVVGGTGTLAELTNSPFNNPDSSFSFVRAPDANRYYVSIAAYITAYEPDGAGDLTENVGLRETVAGPLYLAFSPDGARLFAAGGTLLHVFDVAGTGELVGVTGSPFTLTGVTNATSVRMSADGSLLVVKSQSSAEFHLYTVSAAGTPSEVGGSPFALRTGAGSTYGSGVDFSF